MESNKKSFKDRMKDITQKTAQLYIALRSPKTPWYAKAWGFLTIGYALSPLDLIPDFIPILGYLDDIIILPLMISLCIKMIPKDIWEDSEETAKKIWAEGKPTKWYFAMPIVLIWAGFLFWLVKFILNASN